MTMRAIRGLRALAVVSTGLFCAFSASPSHAADCDALTAKARNLEDIQQLSMVKDDARRACTDLAKVHWIENRLGLLHFNLAVTVSDRSALKHHLEEATLYLRASRWRAHAALGNLNQENGALAKAAEHYQLALLRLADMPGASAPPEDVKRLLSRANAMRALNPTYTRAARTRSGAPGGIAAKSIAGVTIHEVPFPVEFSFNSDEITTDGWLAVQDLFEIIRDSKVTRATLVGHTDPVGTDAYNLALSERRAQSVAKALLQMGISVQLYIRPAGEREPPEFDDPSLYTKKQRHMIMRRVSLDRRN